MFKIQINKIAFLVLLLVIILISVRCLPTYQGDGKLVQERRFSFYPTYEIYFPPFPLEPGKVSQSYRFQGVGNQELGLRLYLLSESGHRIQFSPLQPKAKFLNELAIAVKLRENGKKVINIEQAGLIFGGSGELYHLSNDEGHFIFLFSGNATYELQIVVDVSENSPIPIKVQFALGHGYGCPTTPCKEVLWEDLLKN